MLPVNFYDLFLCHPMDHSDIKKLKKVQMGMSKFIPKVGGSSYKENQPSITESGTFYA